MTRTLAILSLTAALACASCDRQAVNPPTEPANPIATTGGEAASTATRPGVGPVMQGEGPATFVGRWAAEAAWCANTSGAEQPIALSTVRLDGYENSCAIASLQQTADGYVAALACSAEGTTARERVALTVQGDSLRVTWLDRNNAVVNLVRCPAAPDPTG